MGALNKDRDTPYREGTHFRRGVAAAKKIFAGALLAVDGNGYLTPGASTTGLKAVGVAQYYVDNTNGANGAVEVDYRAGIFRFANSAANPVTAAHIGASAYIEDDQTVGSSALNKSAAGRILDVDSDGVWVSVGMEPYPQANDIYFTDVTLTSAQMLALFAAPRTLVAAPGAGLALIFMGALAFLDYAAAAYAGIAAGEDLAIKYTDAAGAQLAVIETTGFLDQANDELRYVYPITTAALEPVANAPLVAHMLVGEIITGDSPVKVRTFYRIVPAAL